MNGARRMALLVQISRILHRAGKYLWRGCGGCMHAIVRRKVSINGGISMRNSLFASVCIAAIAISGTAYAKAKKELQPKEGQPHVLGAVVKMYCGVYGSQRVQITYNNPTNKNYTCHSVCYYSISGGAAQTLDCTGTAAAKTSNGFFCGTNPYRNVRVTNAGNNNCP